jgi:hypothetical protein
MESNDLKITAGSFIVDSELSKLAKLQMLNFIQHEASNHQLMSLLLDGEIVELDEQAEQIIEDRFKIQEVNIIGTQVNSSAVMSRCLNTKCKGLKGVAYKICDGNCGIQSFLFIIKEYTKLLRLCKDDKCKFKYTSKINNYKNKIVKLKNKINSLKTKQ